MPNFNHLDPFIASPSNGKKTAIMDKLWTMELLYPFPLPIRAKFGLLVPLTCQIMFPETFK